ncbi:putative Heme haloperoxidase family profile domain-containing protein [Seiridium unicorne]|uniref:Heme haloperoxidase family profile domain-containing protein n=1 Tax=Seiridium unicorne TaxID=138068 RepID=A0ABR2UEU1_9PEZI
MTRISSIWLLSAVVAFPFIAEQPGIRNTHLLSPRQQSGGSQPGGPDSCPFNPNHQDAPAVTTEFPYNGAIGGLPGKGVGGYQVPAPGDEAHQFIAPTDQDIRGPCPGLNAAANHGFLARDGVTNYGELVDAVQNVYNMGWDLANFLAVFSIFVADGDITTQKLSIGCDATTRTSVNPVLTGSEPGLDGHDKFEADSSLTRNDYFLAGGDNFDFNGTLFEMMTESTGATFDLDGLAKYRFERYQQSRVENPQFFFGPFGVFQHGAASFVYEMFPNGNDGYQPNLANTASFFGAEKQDNGTWAHVPERIPDNWINRVAPYTLADTVVQILAMYGQYPVGFGGNVNGAFVGIDFPPYIQGGNLTAATPADFTCLLYQFVSVATPSSFNSVTTPTVEAIQFFLNSLGVDNFTNLGCDIPLT